MFDILMYGLSVAVVGMATVFLGLIILIGMVKVLEKFVNGEIKSMVQSKIGGSAAPAKDAPAIVIETWATMLWLRRSPLRSCPSSRRK